MKIKLIVLSCLSYCGYFNNSSTISSSMLISSGTSGSLLPASLRSIWSMTISSRYSYFRVLWIAVVKLFATSLLPVFGGIYFAVSTLFLAISARADALRALYLGTNLCLTWSVFKAKLYLRLICWSHLYVTCSYLGKKYLHFVTRYLLVAD